MQKFRKFLIIIWISFIVIAVSMHLSRSVALNKKLITGYSQRVINFLSSFMFKLYNYNVLEKPMRLDLSSTLHHGLNYSKNYKGSKDYLLIAVWDDILEQSIVKLVRINDGKILHKWVPDINAINKEYTKLKTYQSPNRIDRYTTRIRQPFLMSDGSLVFSAGGIYKIDKNSNLIWQNATSSHHTLEPDVDGNFWICSYYSKNDSSEKYQIMDDAIKKINAITGKVMFEKSVFELLMQNGYDRGRFFISTVRENGSYLDYMHLNDVQPVPSDSKHWKKGDLFLSLRNQNMVLLYRPSTNKILWYDNGPWLKQHDINIIDSNRISIFGNNVIDAKYASVTQNFVDRQNRFYIYDFSNGTLSTPYDRLFASAYINTFWEGRAKIVDNDILFVEETNNGRIVCGTRSDELWSYVEKIDDKHLALLNWSQYITETEFKKLTFITSTDK